MGPMYNETPYTRIIEKVLSLTKKEKYIWILSWKTISLLIKLEFSEFYLFYKR